MTSEVAICNSALHELGQEAISSLDENNNAGRLCNANYSVQRDMLLRRHPWSFAQKRQALAELTAAPAFEYINQFALPSDYLAVRYINGDVAANYDFRVEQYEGQRVLLIDEDTVELVYTAYITDPVLFDPLFREALALKIAAKIAYKLTNSRTLADNVKAEAEQMFAEAAAGDSQEGYETQAEESHFLNARIRGRRNGPSLTQ